MRPAVTVTSEPTAGIRVATAEDREVMLAIAARSGLFGPEEVGELEAALDAFLSSSGSDDIWLIQYSSGEPAAIAYYAPERMTNGTWNLYLLAVDPAVRGQGNGAALVQWIEEDLRQRHARTLLIETSGTDAFARQRAFYQRLGYDEEARIRDFYDVGDAKVVYWKSLASPDSADRG